MKITNKTRLKKIAPLLLVHPQLGEQLLRECPIVPYKSVVGMTIEEFGELVEDEQGYIAKHILKKQKTAFAAFGMIRDLHKQMEDLGNFVKRFETKLGNEEAQAQRGVLFPNFLQKMLLDLTRGFHLKSFEEAQGKKVCDWLLLFQQEAANNLYQRNLQKIYEQKSKRRGRK